MEFITASQAAEKWNISRRRVQILCTEGRIPGVFKLGDVWAIPKDSDKPNDKRTKEAKKYQGRQDLSSLIAILFIGVTSV